MTSNFLRRWMDNLRKSTKTKAPKSRRPRPTFETLERRDVMSNLVYISEVHPSGSGNGTYNADWFEVTNAGQTDVNISGWKMDDNSNAFASAVALRGLTTIPAGKSAVFFEGNATGSTDASILSAFSTAWFGSATPPAGFLIGAYGGSGVGLGTSGDSVNLFDAGGNRITGISFGSATATTTFDNTAGLGSTTLPLPTVSTLSVAGVNGAFLSANSAEIGSPGRTITGVDLSTYVRIGRYDLPEPTRTAAPPNSLLAQEASAVTYNWDTDTLFVVGDGGTSVVQVSKTGQLIDSMTLAPGSSPQGTEFYDTEGLTYVGAGKFVLVEERDRQVSLFTYVPGTTLTRANVQTVDLGTFVPNIGIEGISYDPLTGGYIAVKETEPKGIFQTGIDFAAGTATNGSPTTENSVNLFDPDLTNLLDFADIFALSNLSVFHGQADYSHLLVLSQESGKIINIDRSGNISSSLTIVSDPGNPLSVPDQQHEGLTMDDQGFLYVVSENGGGDFDHPQLWVYAPSSVPNQAPTAVALNNQVNSLPENTSTVTRIKVADVNVTDDGLGTNNLTVVGPDASFFEVDSNGLYIKAGTNLDFEAKSSYTVSVQVDDPAVGGSSDAVSAPYNLTLTDDVNENPGQASVYISEVAPWSSGNSPVGADWFEVTNSGNSPVNITGWKMDDNSNSFGSAVALNGITTIAPGESVIFIETNDLASAQSAFLANWFGANPPAGLQIGSYSGSGVGLSTGGDAVNLFNSSGVLQANVTFGASPIGPFASFDNAAGLNNTNISQLSAVGVHGAFIAANDANEIGSPGTVGKLYISEVAPWSSGNSPVGADWFEVTNTTAQAVDITGWKMDDSSGSFAAAVALNGITSIAPGESVIFIETDNLASAAASFRSTWFGANPPAGLQIGSYTGSGVGLSTGGDAVNLYNSTGILQASVTFGTSPIGPFASFDNAVGLNNTTISQLSAVGVHGAFVAANDASEIGSPGTINDQAPLANADTMSTAEDNAATFNVLTNDSDPDGDTLTISSFTTPAHGGLVDNGNGSFTYTPAANFHGNDSFSYTISDGKGGTASATVNITVAAVADAPNLTVTPASGIQGSPIALNIQSSLNDTDGSETLEITISGVPAGASLSQGTNQGGGIWTLTPAQLSGLMLNGANAGSFTLHVVATATETSNNDSASVSADLPVGVAGVSLMNGVLTILGTSQDDTVVITPDTHHRLTVTASFLPGNHMLSFDSALISQIIVQLGDGNDVATIADNVRLPALLDGGLGNDVLQAGGGDTILLGGDGADILIGGKSRDVVIGGLGSDIFTGRGGQDLLIGGTTDYDTNTNALLAILSEWARTDLDLPERMANLRTGGGLNGSTVLNSSTVHDDNATDILSGGSGKDWYWANLSQDILTDKKKKEVVN